MLVDVSECHWANFVGLLGYAFIEKSLPKNEWFAKAGACGGHCKCLVCWWCVLHWQKICFSGWALAEQYGSRWEGIVDVISSPPVGAFSTKCSQPLWESSSFQLCALGKCVRKIAKCWAQSLKEHRSLKKEHSLFRRRLLKLHKIDRTAPEPNLRRAYSPSIPC